MTLPFCSALGRRWCITRLVEASGAYVESLFLQVRGPVAQRKEIKGQEAKDQDREGEGGIKLKACDLPFHFWDISAL